MEPGIERTGIAPVASSWAGEPAVHIAGLEARTRMSFVTHLECARCGARHDHRIVQNLCHCGSPLLVRYDVDAVRAAVTKADLPARVASMWRYPEFLPLDDPRGAVTLGEGWTPILPLDRLG